jgi:hypothetical protein
MIEDQTEDGWLLQHSRREVLSYGIGLRWEGHIGAE